MMKISRLLFVLFFCLIIPVADAEDIRFDLPDPQSFGNDNVSYSRVVTLCCVTPDASEFTYISRNVSADTHEELIENTLFELWNSGYSSDYVFHDIPVPGFELANGTLTVNLPCDALSNRSERQLMAIAASISNTMLAFDDINAVNVLIDSQSLMISGLPIGTFTHTIDSMLLLHADIETARTSAMIGDPSVRSALIYYPAANGNFYLPYCCELTIDPTDPVTPVLNALTSVKEDALDLIPLTNLTESIVPYSISVDEYGKRFLSFDTTTEIFNRSADTGIPDKVYFGAIVLSLTSFVPGISYIRISDGRTLTRNDFVSMIGSTSQIYSISDSGDPVCESVVMGRHASVTPVGVLAELFTRGFPFDPDSPLKFAQTDILGITISDGRATVDLSAKFYTRCQNLNAEEEHKQAYCMINTLCVLPEIDSVRFTIEGKEMDTFVHNIHLSAYLMPDYGLTTSKGED